MAADRYVTSAEFAARMGWKVETVWRKKLTTMTKIRNGIERSPADIPPPDRIVPRYPGDEKGSPQWLKSTLDRYVDSLGQQQPREVRPTTEGPT